MEILLFTIAMLLLLAGGSGITLLLVRRVHLAELVGLSLLFGAAFVSLISFLFGWVASGWPLRIAIALLCVMLCGVGLVRLRCGEIEIIRPTQWQWTDWLFALVLLIQIMFVFWLSLHLPLGWDGLFNFEIRARVACENGGVLPLEYFTAPALKFSHPEYPLLLPLTESWFYGWAGQCHQGLTKLLLPFFYLAAVTLLATGCARLTNNRKAAWLAPLLLFFIPLALAREGSVTSGYADFPLAVAWLAAVLALLEALENDLEESLRLLSAISAILPWIKQEGVVLWLCLMLMLAIKLLRERRWNEWLRAAMPGAIVIIGWAVFLRVVKAPLGQDYQPLNINSLLTGLERLPVIARALLDELVNWRRWSLLWPGLLLAIPLFRIKAWRWRAVALLTAILLPVLVFQGAYLFISTTGKTLPEHLEASLPRLLLQVSLVALLLIVSALTYQRNLSEQHYSGSLLSRRSVNSSQTTDEHEIRQD